MDNIDEIFGIGTRKFNNNDVEVFLTDFRVPTLVLIKQIAKAHKPIIVVNGKSRLSINTIKNAISEGLNEIGSSAKPRYIELDSGLSRLYKEFDKRNYVIKTIITNYDRVAGIQSQLKALQQKGIGKDTQINIIKDQSDKAIKAINSLDTNQMRKYLGRNITSMFNDIKLDLRTA